MSGLPGDSGYGSVRFYAKSGSRLNEIQSLALEGTKVFNDAFEMGYTPRRQLVLNFNQKLKIFETLLHFAERVD